jgi:hypothetical protein
MRARARWLVRNCADKPYLPRGNAAATNQCCDRRRDHECFLWLAGTKLASPGSGSAPKSIATAAHGFWAKLARQPEDSAAARTEERKG